MIAQYDPLTNPDPDEWLALDESERIALVVEYHSQTEEEMPNLFLHCTIHAVIENQVALGDEYPVNETLDRLIDEGLDRHDAIHAIGSVLAKHLWQAGTGKSKSDNLNNDYIEEVKQLTAQKWLDEFG